MAEFTMVETGFFAKLREMATKLHTENRLSGEEMRNMGHLLVAICDSAIEVPDEAAPAKCGHPGCGGRIATLVCDECRSY